MNEQVISPWEDDDEIKRRSRNLWIVVISILIVGLGGLGVFSYFYTNMCYRAYDVVTETARNDASGVKYKDWDGSLIKYSTGGISVIDNQGRTVLNGGFDMKQVQIDTCDDKIMAADIGGTVFYVYAIDMDTVSVETKHPIVRADISSQGVVASLEQDTDSDILRIYDAYNTTKSLLAEIPTNVREEGYPMDFAISADGHSVVASYMTADGGEVSSRVVFYNFSDIGKEQGYVVGAKDYPDTLISDIEFTDDDDVIIFHEKGYDIYTHMTGPEQTLSKSFDQTIMSVAYDSSHVAVVVQGVEKDKKRLFVYDMKGRLLLDRYISYEYVDMRLCGKEIIFNSAHHCDIVRLNGRDKFDADFVDEIDNIFPTKVKNKYNIICDDSIKKVVLKRK